MDPIQRDYLDTHYDENIFKKNKNRLLAGGVGDSFLSNAEHDDRRSLVLLIRIAPDISDRINKCIADLRKIEPLLYYYPKEDFHITLLDILKGEKGRTLPPDLSEYESVVRQCTEKIKPFDISFDGLTASDNAIMVKGYYENELQKYRELLRETFKKEGLLLEERYMSISAHVTIARIPDKLQNPAELISYIEKNQSFGIMTVSQIEFSFHNWYDTQKNVLNILHINK